jgi:hypothetical protein
MSAWELRSFSGRNEGVMSARRLVPIFAAATLLVASSAAAKDFKPGDLRVCNAKRCVPISNRAAVSALSDFYYTGQKPPTVAPTVRLGAPAFELRFRNGYVTGIVATARLDRFLSYGVHLGWFRRGRWHRVPEVIARELRRLTSHLASLRVTRASLSRSR